MTNDELNRRVATLRGRTIIETQEECSGFAPGATWVSGGDYYEHTQVWAIPSQWVELFHTDPASMEWYEYNGIPDYCTDPAAWGALFVALAGEGREVRIGALVAGTWRAVVSMHPAAADSPGRALCLAYVAAMEVPS